MAEVGKLIVDDGGSISRNIERVKEVVSGLERVKELISDLKNDGIEFTFNGETYEGNIE